MGHFPLKKSWAFFVFSSSSWASCSSETFLFHMARPEWTYPLSFTALSFATWDKAGGLWPNLRGRGLALLKQFQLVLCCFWPWCGWCDLPSRLTEASGKDGNRSNGITLFPSQKSWNTSLLVDIQLFSKWEFLFNTRRSPFWSPSGAVL